MRISLPAFTPSKVTDVVPIGSVGQGNNPNEMPTTADGVLFPRDNPLIVKNVFGKLIMAQ